MKIDPVDHRGRGSASRALTLLVLVAAAAPGACGGDTVLGDLCHPGDVRCEENRYEVCADDGARYVVLDDCSTGDQVCVLGSGCLSCQPNTRECSGFDIMRCRPDGSTQDRLATCNADDGDVCFGGECINGCELSEENRSYEGCDYWAVDLDNAVVADQGTAAAQQFSVVVSNVSALQASVSVEIYCDAEDAGNPAFDCTEGQTWDVVEPFPLAPGSQKIIDLDPREVDGSTRPELNDGPGTWVSKHAFHVKSNAPIIAYQFNPLENEPAVFSNDASLLLPTSALGSKYLVLSWPQTLAVTEDAETNGGINLRAFLTIVGTQDDTSVQIKVSTDVIGGGPFPPTPADEIITYTINKFEVINLETGSFNADFTSSTVTSEADKPVAVFTGSEASDVPFFTSFRFRDCCADHLEEQLFPETAFGTQFVAVKTPSRTKYVAEAGWDVTPIDDEPEYWRVMASHEDTSVITDLPPPNDSFLLQRGDYVTFDAERDFLLEASHPVAFGQFGASQQTPGVPSFIDGVRAPGGDPSYMWVPPIEQWRNRYLFLVPNKYKFDSIMIAAPSSARLRYDNIPLEEVLPRCEYEPIGVLGQQDPVEYIAIRCPLSEPTPVDDGLQDDGTHLLESIGGENFGLMVWGWDSFVSYGYPGGANVDLINLN